MEELINKEIAKELMDIKGEVRGLALKSHKEFILKEKGKEGLQKLEDFLEEIGYCVKCSEIKQMDFYPVGFEIIELLAIRQLFGYVDEKFIEIGAFGSKLSLILRLFMRYFVSMENSLKMSPEIWKRYYTVGELEVAEYNKKENYTVLRVKNLKLHPLHCLHLIGYFSNVVRMVIKRPVIARETKCVHEGNEYHEFLIRW